VESWPIELTDAGLYGRPFTAPAIAQSSEAVAVLKLVLRCKMESMTFGELAPRPLRFYIRLSEPHCHSLYQTLFNNVIDVALANSGNDEKPVSLGPDAIRPVGFELDDGLLPYSPRSSLGYRLLTEYFVFPRKFLFFDIGGIEPRHYRQVGNELHLYMYLNQVDPELEQQVRTESFALGCTPVVNLYKQRAEPITVDHLESEYHVVPDHRRRESSEVFSIDDVSLTTPERGDVTCVPLFSLRHADEERNRRVYWQATRRPAGAHDPGTEMYLGLMDLDFRVDDETDGVLSLETTCLNRDLPSRLPFGGGQSRLHLVEGGAPITGMECLTPPTKTLRPDLDGGSVWRLVSHLLLNHLSITGGENGAEAIREILRLYDFNDSPETAGQIAAIASIDTRDAVHRLVRQGRSAPCRGLGVTITFEEQAFKRSGLFLLACVLERFLPLYCSVNSFVQLSVRISGREGTLKTWGPRRGDGALV
jgi:type VI secretion system protein ImpG